MQGVITLGRKPLKLDTDEMKRLYRKGYTLREVADEIGVSRQTVLRRFKKDNFPRRQNVFVYVKPFNEVENS